MNINTVLPTIDEVLSVGNYVAENLDVRSRSFKSQDERFDVLGKEVKELRSAQFSAHALIVVAELLRHGSVDGSITSQAAIAKALGTNGKRITMVKQILENGCQFSEMFGKHRGRFIIADADIPAHVVGLLAAETGGRSIERLHQLYGAPVVTDDETETDETDDQTETDETDTDSFDAVLAFATVVAACRKRGMTDQEITDVYASVIG